jgi:hypothetical protein
MPGREEKWEPALLPPHPPERSHSRPPHDRSECFQHPREGQEEGEGAFFLVYDFRCFFISDFFDWGADIVTVQRMAGYANIQTIARYDRRGEEVKRKVVELLHVPFGGEEGEQHRGAPHSTLLQNTLGSKHNPQS